MNKLLRLLGQEAYDKLKKALGDSFEEFEQQFEEDKLSEEDLKAKQDELGLLEKEEETEEETEETKEEVTEETKEEVTKEEEVEKGILSDGWLLETGEVDYTKVLDEVLVGYIKGLNERLKNCEWDYKYKMAIMVEAMNSSMYDTSDAGRYITMDKLSIDDNGNVIGVKEAFDELRRTKPHLFKVVDGRNPIDSGFNPVDNKTTSKPRSYAEAVEQTRALINN